MREFTVPVNRHGWSGLVFGPAWHAQSAGDRQADGGARVYTGKQGWHRGEPDDGPDDRGLPLDVPSPPRTTGSIPPSTTGSIPPRTTGSIPPRTTGSIPPSTDARLPRSGEAGLPTSAHVPGRLPSVRAVPARPGRVTRPFPTTVLWRWRYEVVAIGGTPLVWWSGVRAAGGLATLASLTGLLAVVALVGPLRRWATAVTWSVITPHRVRVGCAEAGVVSPSGKLPAVLFTQRRSTGERVYLWCPRGLTPTDVAAARRAIAAACWASEVRFYQTSGQYPPLVAVDVIRQFESPARGAKGEHRAGPPLHARFDRHGGNELFE